MSLYLYRAIERTKQLQKECAMETPDGTACEGGIWPEDDHAALEKVNAATPLMALTAEQQIRQSAVNAASRIRPGKGAAIKVLADALVFADYITAGRLDEVEI